MLARVARAAIALRAMFLPLAVLSPNALLLVAAIAILALIILIARCHLNAIISITVVFPQHVARFRHIGILHAVMAKPILWSLLIVGPPVALVTGPFLARRVSPHVPLELAGLGATSTAKPSAPRAPGFGISLFTIL